MSKNASKVVYGGRVIMDLTGDTVSPDVLLSKFTAHDKAGNPIEGTCTYDSDTQDATANPSDVAEGVVFYARGTRMVGNMPMKGAVSGVISNKDDVFTIPYGNHDGSGTVQLDSIEKAKLIPSNIRAGVTILNVEGNMSSEEGIKPQSKAVVPTSSEQVVLPDEGYNCLSQVTVSAIPYVETPNSAGGITVTIG